MWLKQSILKHSYASALSHAAFAEKRRNTGGNGPVYDTLLLDSRQMPMVFMIENEAVRHEGLRYGGRAAQQGCGDSEKGIS